MTHAEEIIALVEYLDHEAVPIQDARTIPLLAALGCATLVRRDHEWIFTEAMVPNNEDEQLVDDVLIALMAQMVEEQVMSQNQYPLLDGLLRRNRWRACLKDRGQTYMLAAMVLHYAHCSAHSANRLIKSMSDNVRCMLSEWLGPQAPWPNMPSLEDTARAMFGDAWWDFVVVHGASEAPLLTRVLDALKMTQPDFLPRVLSGIPAAPMLVLPSMDGR